MSCSRTQRSDAGEARTLGLESSTEPLRSHFILSNGEVIKYIFISVVVIELSVRCLDTGPGDKLRRCLKNSTMNTRRVQWQKINGPERGIFWYLLLFTYWVILHCKSIFQNTITVTNKLNPDRGAAVVI